MKRTLLAILFSLLLFPARTALAAPENANNKVGISLLQPTQADIEKAAQLVNSQGGDWGYVTLVIQENDRDRVKWQGLFDELRRRHLIPIVRLATRPEGENWRRPKAEDAGEWVAFLDSLNWVVRKRYIVLFNEPNHASEWGGSVDPGDFARVTAAFAKKLKEDNSDYFVMAAGLDAAAPSYPDTYEDEAVFFRKALEVQKDLFKDVDGLASHSYPNPGFSGSVWDTGRKSIRGYDWELGMLKGLGVNKELPVFITETGWVDERLTRATIASYFETAYRQIWGPDDRVIAVTPFVFSYQSPPFLGFSWKPPGGDEAAFYPQYYSVQSVEKAKGSPEVVEKGTVVQSLPREFVANSSYHFTFILNNQGQAIWDRDQGYELAFESDGAMPFTYFFSDIKDLEPFHQAEVSLYIKTGATNGEHGVKIALKKDNATIAETADWSFTILPLPKLDLKTSLYPKLGAATGDDFEVQVYDDREGLVFKKNGIRFAKGEASVSDVQNIVLGKTYRIVLLKPYYLPRQAFVTFRQKDNAAQFKKMLPFDFNRDGRMGFDDLDALFKKPSLASLLIP